jgi:hypothetical protein
MSQSLSEIVSAALRQADASVKVASLRDAQPEDRGFARVDQYLAEQLGQIETETDKRASAESAAPEGAVDLDDVRFALKLAEALEYGAGVVEKLALEGPLNKSTGGKPHAGATPRGGPAAVLPHNYDNAETRTPIPQASAHARAAQANKSVRDGFPKNDEHMQLNGGPVIPSGYKNGPSRTTGTSSKQASSREATERLLRSKIAQHKMLVSLGQIDAAEAVLKEAKDVALTANLEFGDNYQAANFPDNEGVRNLTKAQARDRNQREAGSFFGEPVKRDSAVTTHLAIADGLKLSSALSNKLIRSESSTSYAKAPILRDGEPLRYPSATQTANPQARLLGTTPVMPNVERNEALTKNTSGQKVTKVASDDKKPSSGTVGATLAGPAGAFFTGSKENRGRRALGTYAGGTAGGYGGLAAGRALAGKLKGTSPNAQLVGALAGSMVGGMAGSGLGNKAVDKLTRKQAGLDKLAFAGAALQSIGKGTIGALRAGARSVGGGAKALGASSPGLAGATNAVRSGAAKARGALGGIGETGQKVLGGSVLGAAGLGTAGVAHKALGGDRR